MELRACPVRLLTPEIKAWLSLFDLTHDLRVAGPGQSPRFERTSLPVAGGVEDQPVRAMEALTVIRRTWNAVLAEPRPGAA